MLSSIPPQRPAECRDCGTKFAIPATGFLVAKPKATPVDDETERLRERVKLLMNRDRDAVKWRDRWRESNAEGLRLRDALAAVAAPLSPTVEDLWTGVLLARRALNGGTR